MTHSEKKALLSLLEKLVWAVNDLNADHGVNAYDLKRLDADLEELTILLERKE